MCRRDNEGFYQKFIFLSSDALILYRVLFFTVVRRYDVVLVLHSELNSITLRVLLK